MKRRQHSRRKPMSRALRQTVLDRSRGNCDFCGASIRSDEWECHHRLLRSRGGRDSMENLLALHPTCHVAIHGMPAWSDLHGFTVPSWADPVSWPVFRHRHSWQQPGDTWTATEPNDAQRSAA